MTLTMTHVTVVLGVAAIVLVALHLLQQRRTPQSTVAWLLLLVLLPYVAVPLFLMLGFRKGEAQFSRIRFTPTSTAAPPVSALDDLFGHFGLPAAASGHKVDLLEDGQACWEAVQSLVKEARRDLDIIFYLVADDAIGQAFVALLSERARAGVRVRMLIDRLGGHRRPRRALQELIDAGGEIRYFSPLLHIPNRGHINLRNHRKMMIADGARVFAGGRNIGAHYLGPVATPGRWVDLSYVLEGPCVQTFADVFQSDWSVVRRDLSTTPAGATVSRPPAGDAVAQLVPCGPDNALDPLHDGLVNAIHAARHRVWLATPYFVPTEHLEHALHIAGRRGLDVRILLPRRSNQPTADLARGVYLRSLEAAGCRIHFLERQMMHAKAGVIDDAAWVGSANFDVRSMLLNFEATLFFHDAASVSRVADWYAAVHARCVAGTAPAGPLRRAVESVFRLGAPIL